MHDVLITKIIKSYLRKSNDTQLVAVSDHLLSAPHDTVFDRSKLEVKTWPRLKSKNINFFVYGIFPFNFFIFSFQYWKWRLTCTWRLHVCHFENWCDHILVHAELGIQLANIQSKSLDETQFLDFLYLIGPINDELSVIFCNVKRLIVGN